MTKITQFGNSIALEKDAQSNGIKKLMTQSLSLDNINKVDLALLLSSINLEVETLDTEVLHLFLPPSTIAHQDSKPISTSVPQELKQTPIPLTSTTELIMMTNTVEVSMTTQDPKSVKQDSDKSTIK